MKKIIFALFATGYGIVTMAQNTFPATGNVGIGVLTPLYPLDVSGVIHSNGIFCEAQQPGAICTWVKGAANGNANLVLHGGSGNYTAFWFTGANGMLKIGGVGGAEPAMGAINITDQGSIGIGTLNPGSFKLAVEGALGARSLKLTLTNPWPDYVFHKHYLLPRLDSLESYIARYNHLPGVPSAQQIQKEGGVDVGQMEVKLLEKVEELTLYIIQLKKENEEIRQQLKEILEK